MSDAAVLLVVGGVVVVAAIGAGIWGARARRELSPLAGAHAHNDYRQRRPLDSALRYGYVSVEADVWATDGALLVGHDRSDLAPGWTLRRLYLEPLARRVAERGSVYPGLDEPFQLVVEVKSDPEETYRLLETELKGFADLLTRYEDGRIVPGAVRVVISGRCPRDTLAAQPVRYAACDGSFAELGEALPASLVPLISEKLGWRFSWRGQGPMPEEERQRLRRYVEQAHAEGRKVRFWDVPKKPGLVQKAVWRELQAAGVDYLDADKLRALSNFLRRLAKQAARKVG